MKILAKYDFTKFQPPNWTPTFIEVFGENNEGLEIKAKGITEAKKIMREKYRFNSAFVTFKVIEGNGNGGNGGTRGVRIQACSLLDKPYNTIPEAYRRAAHRFIKKKILTIGANIILKKGVNYAD